MPSSSPQDFAAARRAVVVAPAGCGKTDLIARAIGSNSAGRDLVLTHTHAGVRVLRDRLLRDGINSRRAVVETIAGWCLRLAASYPKLSGLRNDQPVEAGWLEVYDAAERLLHMRAVRDVVAASYSGLYVDEYQDCGRRQHGVVLALTSLLRCRIVGDPLQGIFDFMKDEPAVDWDLNVFPEFERLPNLTTPWRWVEKNRELGDWLLEVRAKLLAGEAIDLTGSPARWGTATPESQTRTCFEAIDSGATAPKRTLVAIGKWPNDCHEIAKRLGGTYSCMEPIECRELMSWAEELDRTTGAARAVVAIGGACLCFTALSGVLKRDQDVMASGSLPRFKGATANRATREAFARVPASDDAATILQAFEAVRDVQEAKLYRRELWSEMKATLRAYASGRFDSFGEAAWHCRDRARTVGRHLDQRSVSRTLLVKGLEFDHAIVLQADHPKLSAKELYVALTRGSRSLTVLSASPRLQKPKPVGIPS